MILIIKTNEDDGGVYCIMNTLTNRRYIGMSGNFRLRWKSHMDDLSKGIHTNPILQSDWIRYGKEAFSFQILEKVASKETEVLKDRERVWMRRFDAFGPLGYNLWRS